MTTLIKLLSPLLLTMAMSSAHATMVTWELKDITVVSESLGSSFTFNGSFLYDDSRTVRSDAISDVCIYSTMDGNCNDKGLSDSIFNGWANDGCNGLQCGTSFIEFINFERLSSFQIYFDDAPMDNDSIASVPVTVSYVPVDLSNASRYGHVSFEAMLVARPAAVPQPATFGLMCFGLVGLMFLRRSAFLTMKNIYEHLVTR